MSFKIENHQKSKRVSVIKLEEKDLDRLIFPFQKHTITSLEYKPFSRFTLAKSLDEVFENKLGKALLKILNDRETGTIIIEPEISNKKFDKDFLVKLDQLKQKSDQNVKDQIASIEQKDIDKILDKIHNQL